MLRVGTFYNVITHVYPSGLYEYYNSLLATKDNGGEIGRAMRADLMRGWYIGLITVAGVARLPPFIDIHFPPVRPSVLSETFWFEIRDALKEIKRAIKYYVRGTMSVTIYGMIRDIYDLDRINMLLHELEIMPLEGPVYVRPATWILPSSVRKDTGAKSIIEIAEFRGFGVQMDVEMAYTRYYVATKNKDKALKYTLQELKKIATSTTKIGMPLIARFAPFTIKKNSRGKIERIYLPWSRMRESILPIEDQLGMILAVAEYTKAKELNIIYDSEADPPRVRAYVVAEGGMILRESLDRAERYLEMLQKNIIR